MEFEREGGIDSYLQAIRAHWVLILIIVLATVAGTLGAISLRSPTYIATAKILVSPLPIDDETFLGLQIVRDSGDPTRTVQTAAALIETRQAAELAASRLGRGWTAARLEKATTIKADGESNLLAVEATAHGRELSARIADEYARSALLVRRRSLGTRVSVLIAQLGTRQRSLPKSDPGYEDIARRLNQLESLRSGDDPTLQLAGPAAIPDAPSDPPAWLLVVVAVIGGLAIGSTVALLRETLTQSIRSEQEFRASYPMPILSRVPVDRTARDGAPLSAPDAVKQAYRSVLAQILMRASKPRILMLTSPSVGDGKTTAAVHLTLSAAASGMRVLLVDLGLRRAAAAEMLGVPPEARRLREAVDGTTPLKELAAPSPLAPFAHVLACSGDVDAAFVASLQRRLQPLLNGLLEESFELVIVDAPSFGQGNDSLNAAMDVDDVLLVARLGHTSRSSMDRTRDLLEDTGWRPTGVILIGGKIERQTYRGTAVEDASERQRPAPTPQDPMFSGMWPSSRPRGS